MRHALDVVQRLVSRRITSSCRQQSYWQSGLSAGAHLHTWSPRNRTSGDSLRHGLCAAPRTTDLIRDIPQIRWKSSKAKKGKSETVQLQPDSQPKAAEAVDFSWRDYDPAGGLPLATGDLESARLNHIFAGDINAETGNWILRLMNWRRKSGALIDQGINFAADLGVSQDNAYKALLYLRQVEPDFDENKAGIAWADEQINEISSGYIERAEKLGLYKKTTEEEEQRDDPAADTADVYGDSELVRMRKQGEQRAKEDEARELAEAEQQKVAEQEALRAQATPAREATSGSSSPAPSPRRPPTNTSSSLTASPPPGSSTIVPRRTSRAAWVQRYEAHATVDKSATPPPLTTTARLLPSVLATLATLALCLALHELYTPAPLSARLAPSVPPSVATLAALTGSMVLLAVAYRLPPLWRVFNARFVQAPGRPSASSVVLATFTHQHFSHLAVNAALLWAAGLYLHEDVGRGTFLAVWLATGTVGNMANLVAHVSRRAWHVYGFGCSTAVYGVFGAAGWLRAVEDGGGEGREWVPMASAGLLALVAAGTVGYMLRVPAAMRGVQAEGHLAGLMAGVLCAVGLRWEVADKKRRAAASSAAATKDVVGHAPS